LLLLLFIYALDSQQLKREIGSKNLSPVFLLMKALGYVDGVCGYIAAWQMTAPHAVVSCGFWYLFFLYPLSVVEARF